MKFKRVAIDFFWVLSLTLALFYHNYKHKVVHIGNGDYGAYLNIAKSPFNPLATDEPFNQRQFTPVLARLVVETGIYYPTFVLHTSNEEEQRYFFAFMLVNYIGLLSMFMLLLNMLNFYFPELSYFERMFSLSLIIGSMGFLFSGLSFMTEGWTYFFNLLLFYAFLKKRWWWFFIFGLISIFQRETTILFSIGFFGMLLLLTWFYQQRSLKTKTEIKWLLTSLTLLSVYIVLKKVYFHSIEGGNQDQLSMMKGIFNLYSFYPSGEWVKQLLFTQWIFGFLFLGDYFFYGQKNEWRTMNLAFLFASVFLILVGIFTGIGPNIGRILSSLTPIWVFLLYPPVVSYIKSI
jgi:hypothetical protein